MVRLHGWSISSPQLACWQDALALVAMIGRLRVAMIGRLRVLKPCGLQHLDCAPVLCSSTHLCRCTCTRLSFTAGDDQV